MSIHWLARRLFRNALTPRTPRPARGRFAPQVVPLEDRTVPAYTATLVGDTATFTGDAAGDMITFDQAGGLLRHNRQTAGDPGFATDFDFDSVIPGDQTLSATDPAVAIIVNTGAGADVVTVGTAAAAASTLAATFTVNNGGTAGQRLVVDDSASANGKTYTLTATQIAAPGLTVNRAGAALYAGVDLLTSTQADTISVASGIAGEPYNITAGAGADTIAFADGVTAQGGTVDGGAGTDTLDYSAYTTGVSVNLGLGVPGLTATLGVDQVVPLGGAVTSTATGTAVVSNYNPGSRTFDITVAVSGIPPANATGFGITRTPVGSLDGAFIIDFGTGGLIPDGLGGFTFTATGVTLPPSHEAAFLGGITQLAVRTTAFPGGEIRGQLFSTGSTVAAGTATGTGGVTNLENVTGGGGSDSLVGNSARNVLAGGGGNDTLVGAGSADTLTGGAGDDVLAWNDGDGSDVMDGDGGDDLVQVNGARGATGDVFTVGPGAGGRVALDRTGPGPFALDIGGAETLNVNGIEGDDAFTAGAFPSSTGVAFIGFYGFAGSDTFDITPAENNTTYVIDGGDPSRFEIPGDQLRVDPAGTVLPIMVAFDTSGAWYFGGRGTITFRNMESFNPFIRSANATTFSQGMAGQFIMAATGRPNPTYAVTAGRLPGGVILQDNGVLRGTPTEAGVFAFTVTVSNGFGPDATQTFTLTVTAAPAPPAPPMPPAPLPPNPPAAAPPAPTMSPAPIVVSGPGAGTIFNPATGQQSTITAPFGSIAANVAVGDITGDGVDDFAFVPGAGGGPVLNLVNGATGQTIVNLLALPSADFRGGLSVAVGTGAGNRSVVAVGAGQGGGPYVRMFDAGTIQEVAAFFAFDPDQRTGVNIAFGDVTGDGVDDIIVGSGAGPEAQVKVIDGTKLGQVGPNGMILDSALVGGTGFLPLAGFTGGVFVAAGNLDGDGKDDIVVTPIGGGVYFTYAGKDVAAGNFGTRTTRPGLPGVSFAGGLSVTVADVNGDRRDDVLTTPGAGGGPALYGFDGVTGNLLLGTFVGDPNDRTGRTVG